MFKRRAIGCFSDYLTSLTLDVHVHVRRSTAIACMPAEGRCQSLMSTESLHTVEFNAQYRPAVNQYIDVVKRLKFESLTQILSAANNAYCNKCDLRVYLTYKNNGKTRPKQYISYSLN